MTVRSESTEPQVKFDNTKSEYAKALNRQSISP